MRRFPAEFESLLTAEGRRVLAGTHAACGALADPRRRFVALDGLVDRDKALAAAALLDRKLRPHLEAMARPIPPEAIADMTESQTDLLPKTARMATAYLDSRREPAYAVAWGLGLVAMLHSASYRAFAAALAGRPLKAEHGIQVLRYGAGDYAGPHNDHHPEMPAAKAGYFDLHLGIATPDVAHQWLVYAKAGHFTEMVSVAKAGGITAYRLPFWHYTTPLVAKRGRAASAARWVVLGTFLYTAGRGSR
ncbi:hypothetical protein [Desertibaculum subflavum]|uniref:hypothetical protein n=1 Tax=Desertibaculum subflavum TaxID=2268458 RepID=UPI000E668ED7